MVTFKLCVCYRMCLLWLTCVCFLQNVFALIDLYGRVESVAITSSAFSDSFNCSQPPSIITSVSVGCIEVRHLPIVLSSSVMTWNSSCIWQQHPWVIFVCLPPSHSLVHPFSLCAYLHSSSHALTFSVIFFDTCVTLIGNLLPSFLILSFLCYSLSIPN